LPLPRRPNHRSRAITASAYRIGDADSDFKQRSALPWQNRALEYLDLVPEINFASRFYARMLKQLRIYPSLRDERDQKTEIKTGLPVEVLNRVQDPGGGRSQILASYGRLMFTTGEGLLFGRELDTDRERWSFVWVDEVKIDYASDGSVRQYIHQLGGGKKKEYGPDQAVAYRMWTPHPRLSSDAESPMIASLDISEELIILTKSVRATGVSRLTQPLLFLPSEISPPPEDAGSDEDPRQDPWAEDLIEHVTAQIDNPGTAEAMAPLISWVAAEFIEKIRTIALHDPQTDYMERDLRKEAIDRLAWGLDMPPEALKGLGNSNHWAAMQILGDMWKSHGAPLAEQFCDELSSAYLQPALREAGYPDWKMVVADYDPAQVVVKPDRSDDADKAANLGMVSPRGYRLLKNIPEEYAPTRDELVLMAEFKRGIIGQPQKPAPDRNGRDPARDGPPPPGPEGDSGRRTRVVASSAESYEAMGAAMMALARCRELAGIRLWQKQRHCPDCFEQADGKPHALVASIVGPETVKLLDWTPQRLVRGGTDTFKDMLIYWGYTDTQAEAICELIEGFAARTLFDERLPQLPVGFAAHLDRAKETV
jgi:hypothetical protein